MSPISPNLFQFAPNELSQDAVICWLLSWADDQHADNTNGLHYVGLALLNTLLSLHGEPPVAKARIRVRTQFLKTDIIAEVGDTLVLLIEDKVHAGLHGDQLQRYRTDIEKHYTGRKVLPIFFKTGDQSNYRDVIEVGYQTFLREQLLDLLRPWADKVDSDLFRDFLAHHELHHASVASYAIQPLAAWVGEYNPWIGLYKRLQQDFHDLEWSYVANPNGGFVGCWWNWRKWTDPMTGQAHEVYLQIEQGPLCFKLVVEGDDKSGPRNRWHNRIIKAAKDQVPVVRPARMGNGTWMTAARVERENWMVATSDGRLDIDRTLANLRKAALVIDRALA